VSASMIPTTNEKLAALKANPGLGAECSCFVAVGGKNQNEKSKNVVGSSFLIPPSLDLFTDRGENLRILWLSRQSQ